MNISDKRRQERYSLCKLWFTKSQISKVFVIPLLAKFCYFFICFAKGWEWHKTKYQETELRVEKNVITSVEQEIERVECWGIVTFCLGEGEGR